MEGDEEVVGREKSIWGGMVISPKGREGETLGIIRSSVTMLCGFRKGSLLEEMNFII